MLNLRTVWAVTVAAQMAQQVTVPASKPDQSPSAAPVIPPGGC